MADLFNPVAVLDANVLYPAPLRDFLLRLAEANLYKPIWTEDIQQEWVRNLLLNRPELIEAKLQKAILAMNSAFPGANVTGYRSLIRKLALPDSNDRHVLAGAIKAGANYIITFNTRDFPLNYTRSMGIVIRTPDEFILELIYDHPSRILLALSKQVIALKNPPLTISQVLDTLKNNGLTQSVAAIRSLI